MSQSYQRVIKEHSRTGIAHHLPHFLPHTGFIAMYFTMFTRSFTFSKRTMLQTGMRILQQSPALLAQTIVPFLLPAIQTDHHPDHSFFSFNPGHIHLQISDIVFQLPARALKDISIVYQKTKPLPSTLPFFSPCSNYL